MLTKRSSTLDPKQNVLWNLANGLFCAPALNTQDCSTQKTTTRQTSTKTCRKKLTAYTTL